MVVITRFFCSPDEHAPVGATHADVDARPRGRRMHATCTGF